MKDQRTCLVAAALLSLSVLSSAVFADPIVGTGTDAWTTGEGSQFDFSGDPIPAGFFGSGSDPFEGTISLGGVPDGPGLADTIVRRTDGPFDLDMSGETGTFDIEIVALSLRSADPI